MEDIMSKDRQLKKQEEIRYKILESAKKIMIEHGVGGLSIRKITNALDYSPGIVYHYFKDKNEIIETLAIEGYGKILSSLSRVERDTNHPILEIRNIFTAYIYAVLENPEEYKIFMMSDDPNIIKKTTILEKGISTRSKTMQLLTEIIQKGIDLGQFNDEDAELSAQIIWVSVFGLIIRLITEKNVLSEQIDRLINHHFKIILNGLIKK